LSQFAIQFIVHTFDVVTAGSQTASAGQPEQVTTAAVPVPETEQEAHPVGHCFKTAGVTLVSLYHPEVNVVHLSAVVPVQASQPVGQAVIAAASKKNFGAAARQSAKVFPKHKTQFVKQGVIAVITALVAVSVVPTKYFPQPSIGSHVVIELLVHVMHLSVL
jgi:preprotein translocase subunit SecF